MSISDLTDWHIEGELWCPDCGCFTQFEGTLAELNEFCNNTHAAECVDEDGAP